MSTPARLFLIDGSSQMYRAYHAMRGSGLSGPGGRSTHAVYIFVTMLRKLIQDHSPRYIAASFDLPGPTFRSEMATDYKANRSPMPPDLAEQIPWVHEACEALGVPILTSETFEADDVIGTLTMKARAAGFDVAIVTGDKDFFQLVTDGITVYNPRDDGTWFDAAGVREKLGVLPSQVVDVLALMGDSIDNIKGVPGVGEKGARELIAKYGSLDALLAHASEVPNKRYREGLLAHAEDARQSRELARIRTDVPVTFDPEALQYRGATRDRCFDLFTRLGFRSLVMEFDGGNGRQAVRSSRDGGRRRRAGSGAAHGRPVRISGTARRADSHAGRDCRTRVRDCAAAGALRAHQRGRRQRRAVQRSGHRGPDRRGPGGSPRRPRSAPRRRAAPEDRP
jgi:DNA polymerase-1